MEKNNVSPFGDKIRHLRLENGLSQTELGNKVGLSKRMIVHYEKHVKNPPPEKILAFSNALNVKVDVLINDTAKIRVSNIDPKYARKLEKAKNLPESDQIFLSVMIDNLLKKNGLSITRKRKKGK